MGPLYQTQGAALGDIGCATRCGGISIFVFEFWVFLGYMLLADIRHGFTQFIIHFRLRRTSPGAKYKKSLRSPRLKNNLTGIKDGAIFAAEFVDFAGAVGFAFDGAALAKSYAAGHHFLHTDLAVDSLFASEFGDTRQH